MIIASRIKACAPPSKVAVSRTMVDLLLGSSYVFESTGIHDLKGIEPPIEVYVLDN